MSDAKSKYGRQYNGGARPGVSGAMYDLIESLSKAAAPRGLMHRKAKLKQAEDEAMGESETSSESESDASELTTDDLKGYLRKKRRS